MEKAIEKYVSDQVLNGYITKSEKELITKNLNILSSEQILMFYKSSIVADISNKNENFIKEILESFKKYSQKFWNWLSAKFEMNFDKFGAIKECSNPNYLYELFLIDDYYDDILKQANELEIKIPFLEGGGSWYWPHHYEIQNKICFKESINLMKYLNLITFEV